MNEEYLKREGELYGVPPEEYSKLSVVLRASAKSKWMREQRRIAQEQGVDAEEFIRSNQETIQRTLAAEFPGVQPEPSNGAGVNGSPGMPMAQEGAPIRMGFQALPLSGGQRRVPTSGVPDLVGDRQPRTLADIYSRWPVGREPGYHLRVERTQPRFFQNVPCAGYVGDVSVELNERDFGQYFGGREYLVEVYGPDPRRQDPNGAPVIKRLSDPIKISIPVLPPNMMATSVDQLPKGQDTMYPQQMPYYPQGPVQQQTSPHEVKLVEVLGNMLQKQVEKQDRRAEAPDGMLSFARDASRDQMTLMREQMQAEREARRKAEEEAKQKSDPTVEMLKAFAPNKDAMLSHMEANYQSQLQALRDSHQAQLNAAKERHDGENRRSDERYAELKESSSKAIDAARMQAASDISSLRDNHARELESVRRDAERRESALREELRDLRVELRADADKRIAELKEVQASKIDDLEKGFQREIRAMKESADTRLHVTDQTRQSEILMLREKLNEREQEILKLRAEVEKLGDPVEQIQAMEAKAQALGYVKSDPSAPSGAWEHLAASVGAGIGQMLGSVGEWGPSLFDRIQAGQQQQAAQQMALLQQQQAMQQGQQGRQVPQLPPGGMPQGPQGQGGPQGQQAQQQSRRRRVAANWATEGTSLQSTPPVPSAPLGFQSTEPEAVAESAPREAQPGASEAAQGGQAPGAQPEAPAAAGPQLPSEEQLAQIMPELPPALAQHFTRQHIYGFMLASEEQIRSGMPAETFLGYFVGQFPEQAKAAHAVGLEVFEKYIESIPGLDGMSITSRGGQQWLESLWAAMQQRWG